MPLWISKKYTYVCNGTGSELRRTPLVLGQKKARLSLTQPGGVNLIIDEKVIVSGRSAIRVQLR